VLLANAFPEGYPEGISSRRWAAPALAAMGAALPLLTPGDLRQGRAVSSGIVNDGWRRYLPGERIPESSPEEAGRTLAKLSSHQELTFFAHFDTDGAGHRGGMEGAMAAIERVDAFLGGVLGALPPSHLLLITSDHGNLEDIRVGHTRNPALGVIAGGGAGELKPPASLVEISSFVLDLLH